MFSDFEQDLIYHELFSDKSHILMKEELHSVTKDTELSQDYRVKGNAIYAKARSDHQLEEALKMYSKSISYAQDNSENLALAYSNRSALLHRMGKYKDCLLDINRALKMNISDNTIKIKILCRKVECMAALKIPGGDEVLFEISVLTEDLDDLTESLLKKIELATEALHTRNNSSKLPSLNSGVLEHKKLYQEKENQNPFESCALMYNDKYGRHLIATKDISPGKIIFVEKPYASCLNPGFSYMYCSHCFAKSYANLPCDTCFWSMYCSNKCRDIAKRNYHDIECTVVSYLIHNNYKIDYYDLLSLRSLIYGLKESGSIVNLRNDLQSVDEWIEQYEEKKDLEKLLENCRYFSNGLRSVYSLTGDVPTGILRAHASNVVTILIILSKYTSFFGKNEFTSPNQLQDNEDIVYIGAVLLKLWKRSIRSSQAIHRFNEICKNPFNLTNCKMNNCSIGACTPSMSFFLVHSCYPNAYRLITVDQKVIVFALRPIQNGSTITVSDQQAFYEKDNPHRYDMMKQNMQFICDCEACNKNWPSLQQMYKMPKDHPFDYVKSYNKKESDMFDENSALVSPIMAGHGNIRYNQNTITRLAKATEKAVSCLEQPSIVICELMISLIKVFGILYNPN